MNTMQKVETLDRCTAIYEGVSREFYRTADAALEWFHKMFGDVKIFTTLDPTMKTTISVCDEAVYCVEVIGPVFDEMRQVYCWSVVGRDLVGEIYA